MVAIIGGKVSGPTHCTFYQSGILRRGWLRTKSSPTCHEASPHYRVRSWRTNIWPSPSPRLPLEISILHYFRKLGPATRRSCLQPREDIIVVALCATIACSARDWQEIATFGEKRLDWLKRFLKIAQRHSLTRYLRGQTVFERVNPQAFSRTVSSGGSERSAGSCPSKHIAIDGKTLQVREQFKLKDLPPRRCLGRRNNDAIPLGQVAVDDKSNEIPRPFPSCWSCWTSKAPSLTIDADGLPENPLLKKSPSRRAIMS